MTRKKDWGARTALITGASSGIGAAVARRLARAGLEVALVARRRERLEQLAEQIRSEGGQAVILAADLTQADACRQVFAAYPKADVLINNAGLCWYDYYAHIPVEMAEQLLRLNVEASAQLTRQYLPGMMARGFGRIVNMGSITGLFPMQGTAIYAGSKAFLDAFTTALQRELRGSGVQASVVRAGPVNTDLFDLTSAQPGGQPLPGRHFAVSAERVAEVVWGLIRRPRRVVYVPGILRALPWIENTWGWLFDRVGPVLLKANSKTERPGHPQRRPASESERSTGRDGA